MGFLLPVIPGRAQREPGISIQFPGSPFAAPRNDD
jgi:hypothetical protein